MYQAGLSSSRTTNGQASYGPSYVKYLLAWFLMRIVLNSITLP